MTAERLREALACSRPRCACQRARSGATHCPAHADGTPSLNVAERAGRLLVICRAGCGQDAVLAALRARGLWGAAQPNGAVKPRRARSDAEQARRNVLVKARRDLRRLAEYSDVFAETDSIRVAHQAVATARAYATTLGDTDEAWALLANAAALETDAVNAERPDGGR